MIIDKIKRFRASPERTRITVTLENSIAIEKTKNAVYEAKMSDGKYEFHSLEDLGASAGASGLGTEVNADGNTFVNGLRVADDGTVHQKATETSINSFLCKDTQASLDAIGRRDCHENEKKTDGECFDGVCDIDGYPFGDEGDACDIDGSCCSFKGGEAFEKASPKKCVFKKKHSFSFLLCDVAFVGGALACCKLVKCFFKR